MKNKNIKKHNISVEKKEEEKFIHTALVAVFGDVLIGEVIGGGVKAFSLYCLNQERVHFFPVTPKCRLWQVRMVCK